MGKYPVISVSLKGVDSRSYDLAMQMGIQVIKRVAGKAPWNKSDSAN